MTQTKYTPGPWRSKAVISTIPAMDGLIVAAGNAAICEMTGKGEISQANARLIAAAPELLEALQESLLFAISGTSDLNFEQLMSKCKAAIAKATGTP